jgi:hypothetical protein
MTDIAMRVRPPYSIDTSGVRTHDLFTRAPCFFTASAQVVALVGADIPNEKRGGA